MEHGFLKARTTKMILVRDNINSSKRRIHKGRFDKWWFLTDFIILSFVFENPVSGQMHSAMKICVHPVRLKYHLNRKPLEALILRGESVAILFVIYPLKST